MKRAFWAYNVPTVKERVQVIMSIHSPELAENTPEKPSVHLDTVGRWPIIYLPRP